MPSEKKKKSSLSSTFSKLLSYQKGGNKSTNASSETTPLSSSTDPGPNRLVESGTQVVNETVQKLQRLNASAPYSFRVLGLMGGMAMIVTNALAIVGRALTLNITGTILSFYLILFGLVIVLLEADTALDAGRQLSTPRIQETVRHYAKFLEYSWGRGMLYLFVGTLQVANWNLVDWIVGGFMMFVGVTAIGAGIKTAQDLRRLRVRIQNERDLRARWNRHDKDGNGYLGLDELSDFFKDAGMVMTQNQVVSAYMAMNKNFDDKLSYEELVDWWMAPQTGNYGVERIAV